jgi:hypothetical protein
LETATEGVHHFFLRDLADGDKVKDAIQSWKPVIVSLLFLHLLQDVIGAFRVERLTFVFHELV